MDQWRRRRSDCPDPAPGIPSVLPHPAGQLPPFFLHKRPELINFDLVQVQIAGQYLRQGLGMGRPFMSGDLFSRPQAASSHHDQQDLGHLRRRGLQIIHRRPLRFPKVRFAVPAAIALPSSVAPIAHHTRLRALGIRTRGQTTLLLLLSLGHVSPPPLYSITPS